MMASRRILLLLIVILILLLFLAVPGVSWADTLEDAGRNLARKIAAALPAKQGVAVEFKNSSTLSATQAAQVRRAIEGELAKLGHPTDARTAPLRLSVAENLEDLLLVAEFMRDGVPAVAIFPFPKTAVPQSADSVVTISIQKELVFEQSGPILDFELIPPAPPFSERLLVLEREKLVTYSLKERGWELRRSEEIPFNKPRPRDMRGRIWWSKRGLTIYLPGEKCEIGKELEVYANCGTVAETGKFRPEMFLEDAGQLVVGRNYFLAPPPDNSLNSPASGNYFSAVSLPGTGQIVTGVDGVSRFYRHGADSTVVSTTWGSDIAGINSHCGGSLQILAIRPGDWTVPDAVQAYEFVDGQALAVGSPLEFSGPVMALWTAEDESYVRAVVRNLKTGHYEAYRLTITCGK